MNFGAFTVSDMSLQIIPGLLMNSKPQCTIYCAVIIFLEAQRWCNMQILCSMLAGWRRHLIKEPVKDDVKVIVHH